MQAGDAGAQLGDLAHVLVTDGHGSFDVQPGPGVPVIDMYVRAADSRFVHLDEHLAGAGDRDGHLPQFQAGAGGGFYDRVHHLHTFVLHSETYSR